MASVSRRTLLLAAGGLGAVGLVAAGTRLLAGPEPGGAGVTAWARTRSAPYFIGHRGAAAVAPEHSLPGYVQAVQWAPAVEVSVVVSSDGVIYCMHDLTLDRTTTLTGRVDAFSSAELDQARIRVPRLGPEWAGDRMPPVPRLESVLEAIGGRTVICIESKDGKAFQPMMRMLEQFGLLEQVMIKAPVGSPHLDLAGAQGLPRFGYLGSGEDVTEANMMLAKVQLSDPRDALILPNRVTGALIDDDWLNRAKASSPNVWVYATHRRDEVDYYLARGVTGFVASCAGYVARTAPPITSGGWSGGLVPGLMTADPYSDSYAIDWSVPGAITVGASGDPAYVTLGEFGELDRGHWEFVTEVQRPEAKPGIGEAAVVVLCTAGDSNPASATGSGYRASWGIDGYLRIATNDGDLGSVLASSLVAVSPVAGEWARLSVETGTDTITFRVGQAEVSVADSRWRGGYLHLGSGGFGPVAFGPAALT